MPVAEVAELVDALGSGSSGCMSVGVRVSPSAPNNDKAQLTFYIELRLLSSYTPLQPSFSSNTSKYVVSSTGYLPIKESTMPNITNRILNSAQHKSSPYFIRDNRFLGLTVKVTPSGTKKFIVEVLHEDTSVKRPLGEYPVFSLLARISHDFLICNLIVCFYSLKMTSLINRVFFVSNQKVHPSGQQIYSQLLRYRAFAGSEDSGRLLQLHARCLDLRKTLLMRNPG
jgi:hypothetical protein